MSVDEGWPHPKQVDDWIKRNAGGLPSEKLVMLFAEAIQAIQTRAGATLSEVTLAAIFDRVLHTSQQKFTLFSEAKVAASNGIALDALISHASDLGRDEIIGAFRFFLIELLTLIGNLTADILTKPIYRELYKVKGRSDREDV